MSNFEDFNEFLGMDSEERQEKIHELLANVTEPWLDTPEEPMIMALVGSMRAFMDGATAYADSVDAGSKKANDYVTGVFAHAYTQQVRNFMTVTALSDMKRSLGGGS